MTEIRASIIINNCNYGQFLKAAIDSALSQTYLHKEVIVVDDGSTDNSREIIAGSYGSRIVPVLKENGGQASAFNAGFAVSRGEVVFFLDSDDMLLPTAVKNATKFFRISDVVKVHWPLWEIDKDGRKTGGVIPHGILAEGDLREKVLREGPTTHLSPPTTGNAWARRFLERILPMPEAEYRISADSYLMELAPLFGKVKRILKPQGFYRLHEGNNYAGKLFDEKLRHGVALYSLFFCRMSKHCLNLGLIADPEAWEQNSWFHRLDRATREIAALIPPGDIFILVDEDNWGMDANSTRRPVPFLERDGQYWGKPADDVTAIREFERLRHSGANFIVFAWPAFWWLDYYSGLHHHLRSAFPCVLQNDRLVVFDLRARLPEFHGSNKARNGTQRCKQI